MDGITHVWIEVILVRTSGLGWCLRGSCGPLYLPCLLFALFFATLELAVPRLIESIGHDLEGQAHARLGYHLPCDGVLVKVSSSSLCRHCSRRGECFVWLGYPTSVLSDASQDEHSDFFNGISYSSQPQSHGGSREHSVT